MLCEEFEVEIRRKFKLLQMHLEYLFPLLQIRQLDMNLTVKSTGTHESLVKNIRSVGCSKNDDARIGSESVHLSKKLVQCILSLVIR